MQNDMNKPLDIIEKALPLLPHKTRGLAEFIMAEPHHCCRLSTRKLAQACDVSEATVVRLAKQLGYCGYKEFMEALWADLTAVDFASAQLPTEVVSPQVGRLKSLTASYISTLTQFSSELDVKETDRLLESLIKSPQLLVYGSLSSFTLATELCQRLKEVRPNVSMCEGGLSKIMEDMSQASPDVSMVVVATHPYCNKIIRLAQVACELKITLAVITDGLPCPLQAYSSIHLLVNPASGELLSASFLLLFDYLIGEITNHDSDLVASHRTRLQHFRTKNNLLADRQDTLRIGCWEDVTTLDPAYLNSISREMTIMNCLYRGLVRLNEESWKVEPDLAKSWDVSKNGLEVTLYLETGVKFHHGFGEMTAEDVKFSLERIAEQGSYSAYTSRWDLILDKIEIVGKHIIKLCLKSQLPNLFSSILTSSMGMIVSKKAFETLGEKSFSFNPIGTGPYQFCLYAPQDRIELESFQDYCGLQPHLKRLVFYSRNSQYNLKQNFANGDIDVATFPSININKLKELPNITLEQRPSLQCWWLGLTVNKPPFDNLKVRRAVRYILDIDSIIEKAFYGTAKRANSPIAPGFGYWDDAPVYRQDFKKAAALLDEAGYHDGLRVSLLIIPSRNDRIISEAIKSDFKKAGINVDIDVRRVNAANEASKRGECEMYLACFGPHHDPGSLCQWFKSGQDWNLSQWSNSEYDRLVTEAETEMDTKLRSQLFIEAQQIIDQDAWAVWLTHGGNVTAYQKSIDIGTIYPNGQLAPWTIKKRRTTY